MKPNKYKYTLEGGVMTDEQRKYYEDNGYIIFRNLLPDENVENLLEEFRAISNGKVVKGLVTIMKEPTLKNRQDLKGDYLINKIQDILYEDIIYDNYAHYDKIVNVVKSIVGPNITAFHSMIINKPPGVDYDNSRHPMHQDYHYFPFGPADRIVASWTALERVDESNGCLYAIPGSHNNQLFKHGYPENLSHGAYHGVHGFEHVPRVFLIMEKGDTVFFHPLLLHGSGPNSSKGFRKSITVHYGDTNCEFYNVEGTIQEEVAKEIEDLAEKIGFPKNFVNYWKSKSRLIAGQPGNFQNLTSSL